MVGVEVEGDSRPRGPPGPSRQHRQRQEAAMRDPTSTICHQQGCKQAHNCCATCGLPHIALLKAPSGVYVSSAPQKTASMIHMAGALY